MKKPEKKALKIYFTMIFILLIGNLTQKANAFACFSNGVEVIGSTSISIPIDIKISQGYNQIVDLSKYISCYNMAPEIYKDSVSIESTTLKSTLNTLYGYITMKGVRRPMPQASTYYGDIQTKQPSLEKLDIQLGIVPKIGATGTALIKKGELITTLTLIQYSNGYYASTVSWDILAANDAYIPLRSCSMSGSGSDTVSLDTITRADVVSIGKISTGAKTFYLDFDCPPNAKLSVTTYGSALDGNKGIYKNTSTGTTAAKNIGVVLECDNTGYGTYTPLITYVQMSLGGTSIDGITKRPCKASYYSQGNATEGVVTAFAQLEFTYN